MGASDHDIGWAVRMMRDGVPVRRAGWNGRGMYLHFVSGSTFQATREPLCSMLVCSMLGAGTPVTYLPHVDMRTAQGEHVPWLCSQTDLLAVDWEVADRDVQVSV